MLIFEVKLLSDKIRKEKKENERGKSCWIRRREIYIF
jgi:hypothetical protein